MIYKGGGTVPTPWDLTWWWEINMKQIINLSFEVLQREGTCIMSMGVEGLHSLGNQRIPKPPNVLKCTFNGQYNEYRGRGGEAN